MKLEPKHINLFEKLHKFYVSNEDIKFFEEEHQLNNDEALELANSAGAFKLLNDFSTNLDCQSIGFNGKQEMREHFHQWLITKGWKGIRNISNIDVLLRKLRLFKKFTDIPKKLNTLVDKKKGNKNSLKFNGNHIQTFEMSFIPNNFNETFKKYLFTCKTKQIEPVSKATVFNYYKRTEEKLSKSLNASNIEHLHSQFISLSDFDIFHLKFGCDEVTASEMINSAACLSMLNHNNIKSEIKHLGFQTKEQFINILLPWINEKNWKGLNKISNPSVLRRKATEFKTELEKGEKKDLK